MQTLNKYLIKNLNQTVMISLSIHDGEPFQYNNWNWFASEDQLHLLKDDYSLGHIIYTGFIIENNDGSLSHTSKYHPKQCLFNFYFGGVK